jgi:nitroreductase
MTDYPTIALPGYEEYPLAVMRERLASFYAEVNRRRTVREFSDRPVPRDIIETALMAAGTAPSGANLQPWHFAVVSGAETKRRIRLAAEAEEREFYAHRASPEWLAALEPLGTDCNKPFLETAPCLIAVFLQKFGTLGDGRKVKHYYPTESTANRLIRAWRSSGDTTSILLRAMMRRRANTGSEYFSSSRSISS